ncbi:sulfite exporter TauE/SafE family protein [Patescibacteria group bacterium]|nr:sulfite exporter TauE/SafE family protein [Patescibacteria group bacterium]MBU1472958.1 sulfite exporter TauE/SafE family protein [Patescibacteria group bacterium]MBU2459694.1 sulfite exporter TauE/SafE family protein [Patescibacteria group bacterium]
MQNLWLIFITGLFTGGLTCMAVQGGLLAATPAQQEQEHPRENRVKGVAAFLVTKLFAHTMLGMILGWLGSFFQFSLRFQAGMIALVSIFMVCTAFSMLNVHPVFRYFVIQPPRFVTRIVRRQSRSTSWLSPAILGFFSIFIPCGTTQAMMALAVASRSPWAGALILFAFILGTTPLFFLLGISIDFLKNALKEKFAVVAALIVILMALGNVNSVLVLAGSRVSLGAIARELYCTVTFCDEASLSVQQPTDKPTIAFLAHRYVIDNPVIPAGKKITLTLKNTQGRGCIQAFTIPALGVQEFVPLGQTKTIVFTAPEKPGDLVFSCSMGMYSGKFIVR